MSVPIKQYLMNRRSRMVGSLMGYLETNIFPRLDKGEQDELRRVVRDAVNSYHDSVLDLVKADEGVLRNEDVISLLERLAASVAPRRRQTGGPVQPMVSVTDGEREV